MPDIRLTEVSKHFGKIDAVEDVNLEINNGEYICILGSTGSGKTTILKLIAGLIPPDEGEIRFDGRVVNDLPPEKRNTAYMPQQYSLFPHLKIVDNVAFGPLARGASVDDALKKAHEALNLVKLDHRATALPRELSGGMQQRVALARALASGAELLLLDEPLGALDARLRVELRYHLKSLVRNAGLTAIHVTHDQHEAMIVADRIVVLRAGRVEQVGTPFHIYQRPANLFVANFVGETNFLEGVVGKTDPSGATIDLKDDLKVRVHETSYLRGERVILAIRQELTSLKPKDQEESNTYVGEVRAVRFLGDSLKVELRLTNGIIISARMPITQVKDYPKPEEQFQVSFLPGDVTVFSTPPRGLAKEVEVI